MKKKKIQPGAEKAAASSKAAFPETRKKAEDKRENKGENSNKNSSKNRSRNDAKGNAENDSGGAVAPKTGKKLESHGKGSEHNRDINSKTVFRNRVLCAQFLRDNCNIPALKHVRPEDIEDISERYIPYLGSELNSDSVKKIRILDIGRRARTKEKAGLSPHFLVSLIDHKSLVDYDVSMQLLRYMMCIWTEYRREQEEKQKGRTGRKGFRYPVIIPIVYYEGKAAWTADRRLSGRIENSAEYMEWIPDFKYEVIRIHDYSNEELLKRGDEMSLIMMINKIQDVSDLEDFIHIPPEELDRIVRDSPGHVMDVMVKVMESLCFKIDASEEERTQCVRKVRARKMGYLFENMEHMSLQEERRKTEEQRRRAEEESRRAEEESRRADEAEEKLRIAEETIRRLTGECS